MGEVELKAVYLYNFINFVRWPADSEGGGKNEVPTIGVVGVSPLDDALEKLQRTVREAGKNPITVRLFGPYRDGLDLSRCDLLFVSATEKKNFSRIIESLGGAPVLTVSDADGFLDAGGMIALLTKDDKVRWSINRTPVEKSGLRLSAQLFQIAVNVLSAPAAPGKNGGGAP